MRTGPPTAAVQEEFFIDQTALSVRLRTIAASIVKGNPGSSPVIQLTRHERRISARNGQSNCHGECPVLGSRSGHSVPSCPKTATDPRRS